MDTGSGLPGDDTWEPWLLSVRHGSDASYAAVLAPMLEEIRDRLLDHAEIRAGQAIADIGCGDGLAGLGALEREASTFVTFVDLSPALIAHTREIARQRGFEQRCRFLVASAGALEAIADRSVDVVLVRAVLAYVDDKQAALVQCRRILRSGGRISIVEPIFQDAAYGLAGLARQRRPGSTDPGARYAELWHRYRSAYFPDLLDEIRSNALTNYNERDLVHLVHIAGFVNVRLRLHIDRIPAPAMSWGAFLSSAPRAGVPTVGEVLTDRFTPVEQGEFERLFRASIESGAMLEENVNAYIFADNPTER